ncbi:hypothetical protein VOLCADRAFT_94517 [Volvox carteri f. nagariensis]|uniref:Uncharacterized protein n=1 Tax=Volvox carteri f. nagariensis TaxID=3068 RepID=D8U501_VOLCA|nr:uncharacterized protein VOLCADRAFT_94517 [Volvox carteri f. nagariensis]EFJ45131.1 hypothetical protein VOLCADRAFT_94517 [Volvox carteri f. nagariensis]|eukprot:XP_002953807.1 hypothetical protein VOLCADRAFT_94517 [Volvox carteri f. nagariensis]
MAADTETANTSSMLIDLQPTCVRVGNAEPSCSTAYGEALQQHRLLPGDVELAVLAHALNIALTVFDPDGLQICYWGTSTAPTEVCLIWQTGLAGTPVSYCLLDMVPDAEQHIPGYFGASWRSGAGHSLGISVQLAAWSAVTSVLLASALVVCAVCSVTSTDLHDDLNGNERAEYLAFHPPDYTKAIVSLDAIDQLRIGLEVLGWSMQHNPLVREFLTVAEQVPPNHPLPYLSPADVQSFVANGTPLDYQFGLSAEMAMFPYLFPFGVGAFMGGTTLVKYLAYRTKCLFSVWKAVLAAHVCASPECPAARAKYRGRAGECAPRLQVPAP